MDEINSNISDDSNEKDNITYLSGMYKEWFLDYASKSKQYSIFTYYKF